MSISLADRSTAGDAVLTSDEVEQVPTMLCETDIGIDEPARMLPPLKSASKETTLLVPVNRRARSRSPDTLSILSAEDFSEIRFAQSHTFAEEHHLPTEHAPEELQKTCSGKVRASWMRNKGLAYVLLAQAFGSLMNVTTRILERGVSGDGWHPIQILFIRMSITCALCMLYMWWHKTPEFPLGAKGVRWLLVARGTGGFFGVFGLYYSLQYLPLSDATVLTFLAPIMSCWVCSKLLKDTFSRVEQIAAVVSFSGVVLIARPVTLFFPSQAGPPTSHIDTSSSTTIATGSYVLHVRSEIQATPHQRLAAVGMAMLGVFGACVAYTTIRWIGKRAHPLISVNYFAVWCTLVSAVGLLFVPSISFVLPSGWREWGLLIFIGITGFVMQFLLTAGLRYEKGSRATNMVYSQMLFALGFDKLIWGTTPGVMSVIGSSLILGGAIVVALQKSTSKDESIVERTSDEEQGLVDNMEMASTDTQGVEMQAVARELPTARP